MYLFPAITRISFLVPSKMIIYKVGLFAILVQCFQQSWKSKYWHEPSYASIFCVWELGRFKRYVPKSGALSKMIRLSYVGKMLFVYEHSAFSADNVSANYIVCYTIEKAHKPGNSFMKCFCQHSQFVM